MSYVRLAWRTCRTSGKVPEEKIPAVTGRKGNANKARALSVMMCLEEA
jgi:hypothetical protein